jgi:hypothetical protein
MKLFFVILFIALILEPLHAGGKILESFSTFFRQTMNKNKEKDVEYTTSVYIPNNIRSKNDQLATRKILDMLYEKNKKNFE